MEAGGFIESDENGLQSSISPFYLVEIIHLNRRKYVDSFDALITLDKGAPNVCVLLVSFVRDLKAKFIAGSFSNKQFKCRHIVS